MAWLLATGLAEKTNFSVPGERDSAPTNRVAEMLRLTRNMTWSDVLGMNVVGPVSRDGHE